MNTNLLDIGSWWQSLQGFEKIFWFIALLFSLLFLIQTIFSFAAGDGDEAFGDADAAADADDGIGYGFFTIKNFIAFFTVFGWTGVALSKSNMSSIAIIGVALLAGCLMVAMMVVIMRSMSRLKQSGTLVIDNAIGKTGTVYLLIPGGRTGAGKVNIQLQGAMKELNAITDDAADIATGSFIKVTGVVNNNMLLVSKTL